MLLLSGPSGCGKYQTISLLCKDLSIDIQQWEEPIRYTSNTEFEFTQGLSIFLSYIKLSTYTS